MNKYFQYIKNYLFEKKIFYITNSNDLKILSNINNDMIILNNAIKYFNLRIDNKLKKYYIKKENDKLNNNYNLPMIINGNIVFNKNFYTCKELSKIEEYKIIIKALKSINPLN